MDQGFVIAGKELSKIDVRISYRIIHLFSEGLYSSPYKAIEELVSNAFDAGANNTHVILSPDLADESATIVVIDDGIGMDKKGLREHWIIGVSNKRLASRRLPKGRKQIGKFGIGKLATYVLANRLTHICKQGSKYYAASMDFSKIPEGEAGGLYTEKMVRIPLRQLTEKEAKEAISPWITHSKRGCSAMKLFGTGAAKTWTVAIMSNLKDMATETQLGRLRWVIATAMPLRDDFRLYLNGHVVPPSRIAGKKIGPWIIGKDLEELPRPAPDELQVTEDSKLKKTSMHRFGLMHPKLGRLTGYVEVYENLLTVGKSTNLDRSHGFFVYVRDRLVNISDEYFGIDKNLLRHGTFSRFRMVVHIDRLDDELRSSRETVRESRLSNIARNILQGAFNYARLEFQKHESAQTTAVRMSTRIAASPSSLARKPIVRLVEKALSGKVSPKYINYPHNLDLTKQNEFLESLQRRAESKEGLVQDAQLIPLLQEQGIAILDVESGVLQINTFHPFVATFMDEYEDNRRNLALDLLAMAEVLLEANLYQRDLDESVIDDVMEERDELLRFLVRSTGKRNALLVAESLIDASNDRIGLERELVAAFDSMGFEVLPLGGPGKPDGKAMAHLGVLDGRPQRYAVSLEAKSKEEKGAKVSSKQVGISAIARQRDQYNCDHAIVVGPDFPTSKRDKAALLKEIEADRDKTDKTITLIRIIDLGRLVRLVPRHRIGLKELRSLLTDCSSPEESVGWIDKMTKKKRQRFPYREVLETIQEEQQAQPSEMVNYAALRTALRRSRGIDISNDDVIALCKALSRMAPEYIFVRKHSVEINQRPDKILDAIGATIQQYPEEEQKHKLSF